MNGASGVAATGGMIRRAKRMRPTKHNAYKENMRTKCTDILLCSITIPVIQN